MFDKIRYYINLLEIGWNKYWLGNTAHEELQLHYAGRINELVRDNSHLTRGLSEKSKLSTILKVD